jgi:alanine dehydrogenase
MIVGVVKERKNQENRVGMVPSGVQTIAELGAQVWIENNAGLGSGITNDVYRQAGAKIVDDYSEIYAGADMIVKVKEPLKDEIELYREGQTLYTYLHLAADKELTEGLAKRGVTAIAYETIQSADGSLPLLKPMSEVAGRMSVQLGATHLQCDHNGKGVLLGGVPGVHRGKVTVIGGGIVGMNAIKIAVGLGASVIALDIDSNRLAYLDDIYGNRITTLASTPANLSEAVATADLVIGAVLIPGAKSPKLVTREMLSTIEDGSVLVDVSVDQGGCIETSKPTTYDDPTFVVDGVIHYCVANIPGTVARSSTFALTNATLRYAMEMISNGVEAAIKNSVPIAKGVNTYKKQITCEAVALAHDLEYVALDKLL